MSSDRRIVLKLSGEMFSDESSDISPTKYDQVAKNIKLVKEEGALDVVVVLGAGNILRGRQIAGQEIISPVVADQAGMLATVMNGLLLEDALEHNGISTRLMTAFETKVMAELYIRKRALKHLRENRVVIIAGGLGRPFSTTDFAAAHYAGELGAMVIKVTNVDGVYNDDPKQNPDAVKYRQLSFQEALTNNLKVMDATAFALCRDQKIMVVVIGKEDLVRIPEMLNGADIGTVIS